MHSVLESLGFKQSYSNAAIYVMSKGDLQVILPVFVDDMTFVSQCQDQFSSTILLEGPGLQGTNEEVSPDTSRC